jgi:hypothetical protein
MNTAAPENPEKLATGARSVWFDVRNVLSVLFTPALIAFIILLALQIVRARIMPLTGLTAGPALEYLFYEAVKAFLMTPYAIAVHRFIILGEKTMNYRIAPAEPRFRRFFGWSLALSVLAYAPSEFLIPLPGPPTVPLAILGVGLYIAAIAVGIRAIILFPALAVDAPGANWRQAMADTRGHAWEIFGIIVGATLPFVIVAAVALGILRATIAGDAVIAFKDFNAAFQAIVGLFTYTIAVVIASRLYQWIGVRVKERG